MHRLATVQNTLQYCINRFAANKAYKVGHTVSKGFEIYFSVNNEHLSVFH